jgi:hypothetical protein
MSLAAAGLWSRVEWVRQAGCSKLGTIRVRGLACCAARHGKGRRKKKSLSLEGTACCQRVERAAPFGFSKTRRTTHTQPIYEPGGGGQKKRDVARGWRGDYEEEEGWRRVVVVKWWWWWWWW